MINTKSDRRRFLAGLGTLGISLTTPAFAKAKPLIQVMKDPDCGCCGSWIAIMRRQGFELQVKHDSWASLSRYKEANGIPNEMVSCHTGLIDGYFIEGHVPAADIHRLLNDRPDAVGLSVPGMPFGSPGMGPENERDAYSVFLIKKDGGTDVFNHYKAA
ncbi:DUF411 domain-containing protein [Thalassovita sp.]|uniref:DUF411 domain-containing protein n=1 Tax=Thalassovita sp. TaxID=1979401 RepID=UPI002881D016|nr:DUF411 domain-containing protein [Thalassovita sp.]MDF1804289.1 DUF411 domain-containing protein [Thalassovita sp.]